MRWIVISTVALFAFYWITAASGPEAVGAWQDDAIYLASAKSLGEGHGYRLPHIPGEPRQTKYPILYPAVLALLWKVYPHYPQNLWLLLAPGAAAGAGFVVLSAVVVRKMLGGSRGMAVCVGALAAASPEMLSQVRYTMSDLPFAFLSVAALLCLEGRYFTASTPRARRGWLVASALLIAAAALTRTFGAALCVAVVAAMLLRRRLAGAGAMSAIVAACLLPWFLWRHWAAGQNGAIQAATLDAYALDYWLWVPRQLGDLLRVGAYNAAKTVFAACFVELALPLPWTAQALSAVSWPLVLLHLACYATAALVIVGLIASLRRGWKALHLYAAAYLVMMLVWPFDPSRFLNCWIPFILFFLASAAVKLSQWGLARLAPSVRGRGLALLPAAAVGCVIAALFIHEDRAILTGSREKYSFMRQEVDLTEADRLKEWIVANTDSLDVLASNRTAELFLATGRRGHDFAAWSDPVAAYYGPDRTWWRFFVVPANSEFQWLYDWANAHLERAYRQARVDYYIDDAGHPMAVVMKRFLERHPELFQQCFSTGRTYRVYRFAPTHPAIQK